MATALELGREGWKRYSGSPARTEDPAGFLERREALLSSVRRTAELLRGRFGARRVVLFGSLAHAEWFDAESDVDLAVEGLDPRRYSEAWRAAEALFPDRKLDLIELEVASDSLRAAADRYGIEF